MCLLVMSVLLVSPENEEHTDINPWFEGRRQIATQIGSS